MAKQTLDNSALSGAARKALNLAAILVWAEAAVVGGFAAYLFWGLVSGQSKTVSGELILTLLYALGAGWLSYVAAKLRSGKRWARSAALFWQTCQAFIGVQSFIGVGANAFIGSVLCGFALITVALLFNRDVIASSRQEISGR
jgi:hypothetical protein